MAAAGRGTLLLGSTMKAFAALIIFLMSVYGLSNAIAVLKIGQFIFGKGYCGDDPCTHKRHPYDKRKFLGRIPYFGDLFYCPPCVGFWIGMGFSVYMLSPSALFIPVWWKAMVVDGLAACGMIWLLHVWSMKSIQGIPGAHPEI